MGPMKLAIKDVLNGNESNAAWPLNYAPHRYPLTVCYWNGNHITMFIVVLKTNLIIFHKQSHLSPFNTNDCASNTWFMVGTKKNKNKWQLDLSRNRSATIGYSKASDVELWWVFFICTWINDWVTNPEAGDLECNATHYDVILMWNNTLLPWKSSAN